MLSNGGEISSDISYENPIQVSLIDDVDGDTSPMHAQDVVRDDTSLNVPSDDRPIPAPSHEVLLDISIEAACSDDVSVSGVSIVSSIPASEDNASLSEIESSQLLNERMQTDLPALSSVFSPVVTPALFCGNPLLSNAIGALALNSTISISEWDSINASPNSTMLDLANNKASFPEESLQGSNISLDTPLSVPTELLVCCVHQLSLAMISLQISP